MKKQRSTKRALLLSALSLLLCMAMLVGSTFAWFTDSVTSGRNTIVSGQLDVNLYYATLQDDNTWTEYAAVTEDTKMFNENALYEPGYTEVVKFKVVNEGTLALKYSLDAKIYHETAGKNVYGESFNLSNYLYTGTLAAGDYNRDAAVAAATTKLSSGFNMKATNVLQPEAAEELVLVLTMPTTVGNEANHVDGFQPVIDLGIVLIATQATYEADDFDNLYDENAQYPVNQAVTAPVADTGDTTIDFVAPGTKLPNFSATVPESSVDTGATELVLTVKEQDDVATGITVSAAETATTYDIDIEGVADGADVTITMNIGAGLTSVELYHNATLIPSTYDPATGDLTFTTQGFSPFTVVHAAVDVAVVDTEAELAAAVAAGGKIVLTSDITVTNTIPVTEDVVIDLDGYALNSAVVNARAFQIVASDVDFTLEAAGSAINYGTASYGYIEIGNNSTNPVAENVTVTVNGGTFTGTTNNGCFIRTRANTEVVATLNNVTYTDNYVGTTGGMIMDNSSGGSGYIYINGGEFNANAGLNTAGGEIKNAVFNTRGVAIETSGAVLVESCTINVAPGTVNWKAPAAGVAAACGGSATVKACTIDVAVASGSACLYVYNSGGSITAVRCELTGTVARNDLPASSTITVDGVVQE